MHFCGLGYSRPENPRGQTSDNFIDIRNLTFEPHFYCYLKPAFSPVASMIDFWAKSLRSGQSVDIPVCLINDTYVAADSVLKLDLYRENQLVLSQSYPYQVAGLGRVIIKAVINPMEKGNYRLEAVITYRGETIKSIREFQVD